MSIQAPSPPASPIPPIGAVLQQKPESGIVEMSSGAFDIQSVYLRKLRDDAEVTMPVAAIEALVELLAQAEMSTISELMDVLQKGISTLKASVENAISLSAGCDLFLRYVIRSLSHTTSISKLTSHLLSNARLFVTRAKDSRKRIAKIGSRFLTDGCTILTHSHSRVVTGLLMDAIKKHVRFKVIVTEGRGGETTAQKLRERGVPVAVISNSAIGYAMSLVDMCFVGAEGVVENGGIINVLGTYQIAVLAKNASKPFYVVAETHKFVRSYPLNGMDLPVEQKVVDFSIEDTLEPNKGNDPDAFHKGQHHVDFTPPSCVSAIITEGGVLTPGAVSEELIKIWF